LWGELYRCEGKMPSQQPAGCGRYTLFQSYAWNEIAARLFAERERPYVVVAESDSGAAIIPACVRRESVSLLGEELFDYRDVITVADEELAEAAWEKVKALALPFEVKALRGERPWGDMKSFAGAPYRSCTAALEKHHKLERNLRLLAKQGCESGHRVIGPSGDRLAALAEALPLDCASPAAKAPLGVTNGLKRPTAGSIGVLRCAQDDNSKLLLLVRRMYELKARHESGSLFRDPLRIEAVLGMAASAPTELFTIENGGDLVAAVLTFIDGYTCRFYGTYYDARWARYSPGVCLLYRVIQQAQARGLDFDFMTGEQPYKMRFASGVVPLYVAYVPVAAKFAA
jgi:hypothetical protein